MFWLYFLTPVLVICGIAWYFGRKTGMKPVDENKQLNHLSRVMSQNEINRNSSNMDNNW